MPESGVIDAGEWRLKIVRKSLIIRMQFRLV